MKARLQHYGISLLVACIWSSLVFSQITPAKMQQVIMQIKPGVYTGISEFYARLNYRTAWIQKENAANRNILFTVLRQSAGFGLQENDYRYHCMDSLRRGIIHLQNTTDSIETDLRVTDAAIHFFRDITYGNSNPLFGFNGLNYSPGCYDIPGLLAEHISKNELQELIDHLSPALPEISVIEKRIKIFIQVLTDTNFRETKIISNKVTWSNTPLVSKLYHLGVIETVHAKLTDSLMRQKVKESQKLFNLLPDGVLRSTILQELNVPLTERLQQLNLSVNYYRWLYCLVQNQSVIVVNIPAAYMKVYRDRNIVLEMRMIVGKRSTPTPTLASFVNEVILYPYWHVPFSIATKEILPAAKRNPGFINAGNYQVLNKAGKIIDPYAVNWHALSTGYFPYTIRQSTGCDNSLGLIKLNFYSPFDVYLHDTPNKNLFMLNKRFFSHGCMRMEKPMELGHLVLKENPIAIDTLEQKGCLRNQSPVTVKADEQMKVIVWYNPAGIDAGGKLIFYEDVYGKFIWMNTNIDLKKNDE